MGLPKVSLPTLMTLVFSIKDLRSLYPKGGDAMVENPQAVVVADDPIDGDNIPNKLVSGLYKCQKEHHENWLYQENSSMVFYWLLLIPMPASILTSHSLTNGLHFFGSFCVYLASCSQDLPLQNISFVYCLWVFLFKSFLFV